MSDRWVLRMILGFVGWGGIVFALLAGLGAGFGAASETAEGYRAALEEWAALPGLVWGFVVGFAVFVIVGALPAMLCLAMVVEDHLHSIRLQTARLRILEDYAYRIAHAKQKNTNQPL